MYISSHLILSLSAISCIASAQTLVDFSGRAPLSYATTSNDAYTAPKREGTTTLMQLIRSRPELSRLSELLSQVAGFTQAFDTDPTWQFTFFAPSDTAFANLGTYYNTFAATRKGKWWIGNQLMHHYVPNSRLNSTAFNETASRVQSGVYLFIGTQTVDDKIVLNNVSRVTEADIPVTSGVVHIIDHVLDPSAQIYNADLPGVSQSFIAGSCANPALPYC